METACVQAASVAVAPAVSHTLAAVLGGFPALVVAILGWYANRKDWNAQTEHLQNENEKLTEALRLALYARGPNT